MATSEREEEEEDLLQPHEEDSISSSNPKLLPPMTALEILREAVRILRREINTFISILFLLICPVSAALLSDAFVSQSLAAALSRRLVSAAVPRRVSVYLTNAALSAAACVPLFLSFLLLAKTFVACTISDDYAGKNFDLTESWVLLRKTWRRLLHTYLWIGAAVFSCLLLFLALISVFGLYPSFMAFSFGFAYTGMVCNVAGIVTVLEDSSGIEALQRANWLVWRRAQTGFIIFFGSMVGLVFVQGLFEHRVRFLSYGDGSSRIWEAPLLVLMHSFLILVDFMVNVVFYFTCRSEELFGDDRVHELGTVDAS